MNSFNKFLTVVLVVIVAAGFVFSLVRHAGATVITKSAALTGEAACLEDGSWKVEWELALSNSGSMTAQAYSTASNTVGSGVDILSGANGGTTGTTGNTFTGVLSGNQVHTATTNFPANTAGSPAGSVTSNGTIKWSNNSTSEVSVVVELPAPCPPPVVDVCSNIDGDQTEVPDGYHAEDGQCYENPSDNGGGSSNEDEDDDSESSGGGGQTCTAEFGWQWILVPNPDSKDGGMTYNCVRISSGSTGSGSTGGAGGGAVSVPLNVLPYTGKTEHTPLDYAVVSGVVALLGSLVLVKKWNSV